MGLLLGMGLLLAEVRVREKREGGRRGMGLDFWAVVVGTTGERVEMEGR